MTPMNRRRWFAPFTAMLAAPFALVKRAKGDAPVPADLGSEIRPKDRPPRVNWSIPPERADGRRPPIPWPRDSDHVAPEPPSVPWQGYEDMFTSSIRGNRYAYWWFIEEEEWDAMPDRLKPGPEIDHMKMNMGGWAVSVNVPTPGRYWRCQGCGHVHDRQVGGGE